MSAPIEDWAADWLFDEICALNWHPFLRINHQGTYQIRGQQEWRGLDTVVPHTGMSWSGVVTCFKSNPRNCSLLARWDEGYKDPWLIVTDLKPEQGNPRWYGFRSWIESSYRDVKSDGRARHKTRLREPQRAERLWLAMAVATLWTVTVGGDVDQQINNHLPSEQAKLAKISRQISCFLQGLLRIIADLLNGKSISLNGLFPFPSPVPHPMAVNTS